jgi:hypothetical protein
MFAADQAKRLLYAPLLGMAVPATEHFRASSSAFLLAKKLPDSTA